MFTALLDAATTASDSYIISTNEAPQALVSFAETHSATSKLSTKSIILIMWIINTNIFNNNYHNIRTIVKYTM